LIIQGKNEVQALNLQNDWGNAPLHIATYPDDHKILELLMKHSREIDLNLQKSDGLTTFHFEAMSWDGLGKSCNECLEVLLDAPRILIDYRDGQGRTPLVMAAVCRSDKKHQVFARRCGRCPPTG